jgi:hypothetical protein
MSPQRLAFAGDGAPEKESAVRASLRVLFLAAGLSAACATGKSVGPNPEWLGALIHSLESQPVANPPAFIARYDYGGRVVYYLPPRCCDIPSNVYSADGTIICNADGGLTGKGDGRCPDFLSTRKNETIVWRDPRGSA